MRSNAVKIRKDFKPLITSCALVTLTPNSPTTQVYNSEINEWEPDRESGTWTVICPVMNVTDKENTFRNGRVNDLLGSILWTVNGVDITTLAAWENKYAINNTPGEERGSITIKKNILPSDRTILRFKGSIADTRLGINVWFEDEVILSTHDKSEDSYTISISEDTIMKYNPLKDRLLEYDYKVAHGIIAENAQVRADCIDINSYLRTVHFNVFKGKTKLTSLAGYQISLFQNYSKPANYVALFSADQDPSFVSIDTTAFTITFDLRLLTKMDYLLKLLIGGKEKASVQFSLNRVYPKIKGEVALGSDINPGTAYVYNKALVSMDGKKLAYPSAACKIVWATEVYDAATGTKTVTHNEGEQTVISLQKAGIGDTDLDGWMNIYFTLTQKETMKLLVDSAGDYLADENGNKLFCN